MSTGCEAQKSGFTFLLLACVLDHAHKQDGVLHRARVTGSYSIVALRHCMSENAMGAGRPIIDKSFNMASQR